METLAKQAKTHYNESVCGAVGPVHVMQPNVFRERELNLIDVYKRQELGRITEPFYMVDKSRARAQNGSGLGLALCQRIAAAHQTALEFESEVGRGTTVRLPLQRGAAP